MFHAHQSEFTELGWQGFFEVSVMAALGARGRGGARLAARARPARADRRGRRAVRRARRARPRRPPRAAGGGAGGRAHRARAGRDRADRPQRRPRRGHDRAGASSTTRSCSSAAPRSRSAGSRPRRCGCAQPWIEGEAYEVALLTSTGGTIAHEIPVAVETPATGLSFFALLALLGIYVGVIPVALGMLWLPWIRRIPPGWLRAVMARDDRPARVPRRRRDARGLRARRRGLAGVRRRARSC